MSILPHDIAAAARRIAPYVRRTPILRLAPGELGLPFALTLKLELLRLLETEHNVEEYVWT